MANMETKASSKNASETAKMSGHKIIRNSMTITEIAKPFASVIRVSGIVKDPNLDQWLQANNAVRIEMDAIGSGKPITRVYTIRDYYAATNIAEIDFVVHHGQSLAMDWLSKQKIGDKIYLMGPKQHFMPDYKNGHDNIFFADDTAIPALFSIFKNWPQGLKATAYIDCAHQSAIDELPKIAGVDYKTFIRQDDCAAGTSGFLVKEALSINPTTKANLWIACEREEARQIRDHFLSGGQVAKADIKAIGYWKRGMTSSIVDEKRMAHYIDLTAQGKGIEQFDEFDVKI
ncbi:siderophore-interacting protein [Bartonella sp. HY761]|uniref:siderophore-interacting protein n=1 Tax=Bartonella sp. HY761 TaxID=2979330 RepID=UPI00220DD01A|nr:siderophore-interacting protein [Bartonella sp. HY761]UXN05525.1 siderophore-interacting protein [Bartonella sp. HY761]